MDTFDDYQETYDEIAEMNYEIFFEDVDFEVDYDEYLLKVDVAYRVEYGIFPIGDQEIETRLDEICERVAYEYIRQNAIAEAMAEEYECDEEENEDEELFDSVEYDMLKEKLLDLIEMFLKQKSKMHDQEYPQSRMFKRKDFWMIQHIEYAHDMIDSPHAYMEIFKDLIKEGYYVPKEKGGDPKHDIFYAELV